MKVVVHYPFVPHYRIPVFNALVQNFGADFEVWSSLSAKDKYLKSNKNGWKFTHKKVFHKIFFNKLEVEVGIFRKLFSVRPDFYIVLGNPNIITSWVYPVFARLMGTKVLFWTHGLLSKPVGLRKVLLSFYYRIPHGFLLYGERAIPLMLDLGLKRQDLHPIYNSLDYSAQRIEREKLAPSRSYIDQPCQLVVIGRLMKKLKIDLLIQYLAKYNFSAPRPFLLVIVGDGAEREVLEKLVFELGVKDFVKFKGAVYDEAELAEIYCSSTASVIMGVAGLAVMHSLAYGVPVVTHDNLTTHCPEIEALINNPAGVFFKEDDYSSFAEALNSLKVGSEVRRSSAISVIEKHYTPEAQLEFIREALNVYQ